MASNQDWMKMTKGGSRTSEYSEPEKPKKKKKKNPTSDLSVGGAVGNLLSITGRRY